MKPCSSPSALMPSVCGVMSTRIGPTSMPAINPPCTAAPMRDRQVRLDLAVHRTSQPLFKQTVDKRRACGTSNEHNLVDLVGLQHRVG